MIQKVKSGRGIMVKEINMNKTCCCRSYEEGVSPCLCGCHKVEKEKPQESICFRACGSTVCECNKKQNPQKQANFTCESCGKTGNEASHVCVGTGSTRSKEKPQKIKEIEIEGKPVLGIQEDMLLIADRLNQLIREHNKRL